MGAQKKFDATNFKSKVIEASKSALVLVHFLAIWCGPCRAQRQHLEDVLAKLANNQDVIIGEFDVEGSKKT